MHSWLCYDVRGVAHFPRVGKVRRITSFLVILLACFWDSEIRFPCSIFPSSGSSGPLPSFPFLKKTCFNSWKVVFSGSSTLKVNSALHHALRSMAAHNRRKGGGFWLCCVCAQRGVQTRPLPESVILNTFPVAISGLRHWKIWAPEVWDSQPSFLPSPLGLNCTSWISLFY